MYVVTDNECSFHQKGPRSDELCRPGEVNILAIARGKSTEGKKERIKSGRPCDSIPQ